MKSDLRMINVTMPHRCVGRILSDGIFRVALPTTL